MAFSISMLQRSAGRPSMLPAAAKRHYASQVVAAAKPQEAPTESKDKKRAPSAFNLFVAESFAQARARANATAGAKLSPQDCLRDSVKAWASLPEAEKQPYIQKSNVIKEDFAVARQKAREASNDGRGPRPMGAYAAFHQAQFPHYKERYPDSKSTEITKMIAQAWNQLPAEQKDVLTEQYKARLAAWNAKRDGVPAA